MEKLLANKIIYNIRESIIKKTSKINFSVSIGVASYEESDSNINDIIQGVINYYMKLKELVKIVLFNDC